MITHKAEIALAIGISTAAMWLAVPPVPAHADNPGCRDSSDPSCGGHAWNGPLRDTWDTPGYFGGWNNGSNGPELCSPFTYECQGVTSTP